MFNVKGSISKQIIRGFSIFIIVFSLLFGGIFYAVTSYINNNYVLPQFENVIELSIENLHSDLDLKQIKDANAGLGKEQEALVTWFQEKKEEFDVEHAYVLAKQNGLEYVVAADKDAGAPYKTVYPFTEEMDSAFAGQITFSNVYEDDFGVHKSGYMKINDHLLLGIDMDATFISELEKSIMLICAILAFITIIVGAIIANFFFARPITSRIQYVLDGTKKMASGDLTSEMEVRGEDELAQLAMGFNEMVNQLRGVTLTVVETSDAVATSSSILVERAREVSRMTHETAASAQEINSGSETIVSVSEENASAMEEITQGVQEIALSSSSVLDQSELASKEAENGNGVIQSAMTQMNSALHTSIQSVNVIEAMNRRTNEIGEIARIITDIAGQINLLSLNAAIEAARAGEHGKGFAVVADEIRKLADQSAMSASQITSSLTSIQDESFKSVESMKEMKKEVDAGSILVNEAGEAFSKLYDIINNVNQQTHSVSVATQQIAASVEEINASLEETASITENALRNTQTITAATQEQLAMMEETEREMSDLNKISAELKGTVHYFKV